VGYNDQPLPQVAALFRAFVSHRAATVRERLVRAWKPQLSYRVLATAMPDLVAVNRF
jgi:hypothetical protein